METNIKFGLGQMRVASPAFIGRAERALAVFSAGVVMYLPTIATKLHTTVDDITFWLGLSMLVLTTVASMFGVHLDPHSSVPADQVREVETPVQAIPSKGRDEPKSY